MPFSRDRKSGLSLYWNKKKPLKLQDLIIHHLLHYRPFQLHYVYMASWSPVQLFLFLIQSVFDLLLYHINQKAQTIEKSWNTFTMMKLRQWVAIRIQMAQELSKKSTIQSFWSLSNSYNFSFNRHWYQVLKRYLNVEFSSQMSYNNAPWFWKIE